VRRIELEELERVVGTYSTGRQGPLFVVTGGIHGNEPAGIAAVRRVLDELATRALPLRGKLLALAGNLRALGIGDRYVDLDLNRAWTRERVAALERGESPGPESESVDQVELHEAVRRTMAEGEWDEVVLVDLHSTSADGAPFTIIADTLQNRRVAFSCPIPALLGLEERVDGTLLSFVAEEGHVAICLEGGQNDAPSTVDHHEAALWLMLVAAGALEAEDVPELEERRAVLEKTAWGLPRVVEVRYRFPIPPGFRFHMIPGYANFDIVPRGEHLADVELEPDVGFAENERIEEVRSPAAGLLLMPRYQGQGDDGFFLGREVRPFWLRFSGLLRRLRLSSLVTFLPGVRREGGDGHVLTVDPRVARWLVVELFHLFGYRWVRNRGERLVFVRRPDR